MRPHVKVGGRYRVEDGEIVVDSITPIGFPDITPELARESGFLGVIDLLKVAKHGKGERIFLVPPTNKPQAALRPPVRCRQRLGGLLNHYWRAA